MSEDPKPVLLFADRLPPLAGGMEVHAGAFMRHFHRHERFPLEAVVTRDSSGRDCLLNGATPIPMGLTDLPVAIRRAPAIVFFNSGRWIEDLANLRGMFPNAHFVYRTGGNEILKAPLDREVIADHRERQRFWTASIAANIDVVVTNSAFTERRLQALGLSPGLFARCVGGVDRLPHPAQRQAAQSPPVLVCAARFVPYKNHKLLLETLAHLAHAGHAFEVRLVGDGPLMAEVQQLALQLGIGDRCNFLGLLSNAATCREIAAADAYVQFSVDRPTPVPGGSYVHAEGMGRSLLEAITYGTFAIALRSGALEEIVTPQRGLLLAPAEPVVLARQIGSLLRSGVPRPPPTDDYLWPRYFRRYEAIWEGNHAHLAGD